MIKDLLYCLVRHQQGSAGQVGQVVGDGIGLVGYGNRNESVLEIWNVWLLKQ